RGLLVPRAVFDKIGQFDAKTFPHYAADYDFTLRARQHGFKVFCNYDARLYIYPDASGNFVNRSSLSIKRFYSHLFGIKGGGNLRNYTLFVFRHCPPMKIPLALLLGYLRRIGGFWLNKHRTPRTKN